MLRIGYRIHLDDRSTCRRRGDNRDIALLYEFNCWWLRVGIFNVAQDWIHWKLGSLEPWKLPAGVRRSEHSPAGISPYWVRQRDFQDLFDRILYISTSLVYPLLVEVHLTLGFI